MSNAVVPQGESWGRALEPQVRQMADSGHYTGSREERDAQALRDIVNTAAERHELQSLTIGGMLVVIRNRKLYERLGYDSMKEFLQQEKVARVGRSQLYTYMKLAEVTPPAALSAPTLDTSRPTLSLTPQFVEEHGTQKSYALAQRWEGSTPEQREEMLDTLDAPSREFYKVAYGKPDQASFTIEGDDILLWQDGVSSTIAVLKTTDREERRLLLDRLNLIPRARV